VVLQSEPIGRNGKFRARSKDDKNIGGAASGPIGRNDTHKAASRDAKNVGGADDNDGFLGTLSQVASDVTENAGDVLSGTLPKFIDAGGGSTSGDEEAFKGQNPESVFPEKQISDDTEPRSVTVRRAQSSPLRSPVMLAGGAALLGVIIWAASQ
jgi:hypothetical protein